ncbi:hypothetical protein I4902_12890 [Proteus alimentorum]|uniref:Uncharacterized protein n=1 Tax=Proteus alimentorum TaxID=1973495 RepID=A0ABS0IVV5_9GAMM|nr:hypothetical protein [Proteus alimentorum]MBG2876876.1 hypothetical protein [Proteus alimentorum]MBG2880162.1 hypothetical protein [Proteus alimentorum]
MKKHPNKHIQSAIEYALEHEWVWIASGSHSHTFCKLRCGNPANEHKDHQISIWCTPSNMENHAKQIIRKVNQCF